MNTKLIYRLKLFKFKLIYKFFYLLIKILISDLENI